jgi:CBS domain-containing protein
MSATGSFRIHGPRGIVERVAAIVERARKRRTRTVAAAVPICEIMSVHVVCAFPDLELATLIDVMVRERIGCVPVVDEHGQPVGMVTKLDIVEQLASATAGGRPLVSDVMMPLAITLDDHATVGQAAALMASEDMHHVMIVSGRRLVGVVSTMDVTRWLAHNDGSD